MYKTLNDDKIYIQNNGYDGLVLGYQINYKNSYLFRKGFFVKHIILISSLVRKVFLSSILF